MLWWCLGAAAVSAATAALVATHQGTLALPIVLWLAGVVAFGVAPMRLWLTLPAANALWRLGVPLALLALAACVASRAGRLRGLALPALLIAAAAFGLTARAYFITSAGSWDVEYWKAITTRVVDHGITRAYGDPGSVPPGSFLAQLTGAEPAWKLQTASQDFVVDPPPLMMVLWRISHSLVDAAPYLLLSIPRYVTPVSAIDTRAHTGFRYQELGAPFEYEMVRFLSRTREDLLIPR